MSKFGLDDLKEDRTPTDAAEQLSARLSRFPSSTSGSRQNINTAEIDAAAAPHGFVSRDPIAPRGRRSIPKEPTKAVGFNLPVSDYERFKAFADRNRVSFQRALGMLLQIMEGKSQHL